MFKKALSLLLSMMLVVTSLVATVVSVSAAGDSYFVSGSEELTGYKWAETEATCGDNVMTENGDGNYEKVFTNVAVGNGYQFKVVHQVFLFFHSRCCYRCRCCRWTWLCIPCIYRRCTDTWY